ncbi:MAG TPA: hypothetical protein VMH86_11040 [Rhizomicrobium sp.]|nr:hypothetical protein [Rhizomicrobium sp.]
MIVLPYLVFTALILAAAAFVAWPVLHAQTGRARLVLAGAVAALVLGIGAGVYLMVGSPELALREAAPLRDDDLRGIVARLVANARAHPTDPMAWAMLGRGYLLIHDGQDAAGAFREALPYAPKDQQARLYTSIAEALTAQNDGTVTPDAETALNEALKRDPGNRDARYLLGLAYAQRHDNAHALALWNGILAELPADSPGRDALLDNIASLAARSGGAPDVTAMVAGLAARLKTQPNDPEGWQRLVRAYTVLGDRARARAALADARAALKADTASRAALDAEARELGLDK